MLEIRSHCTEQCVHVKTGRVEAVHASSRQVSLVNDISEVRVYDYFSYSLVGAIVEPCRDILFFPYSCVVKSLQGDDHRVGKPVTAIDVGRQVAVYFLYPFRSEPAGNLHAVAGSNPAHAMVSQYYQVHPVGNR